MPVKHSQIGELLTIIQRYVPQEKIGPMLAELRSSEPAQCNKSFATTIWRLLERWADQRSESLR